MPEGYSKGKPEVSYWLRQIRHGLEYRKKSAFEASWDRWRQYYRGEWADGVLPTNVFFKMIRTTVPRIYFRNPSISIVATMPGIENAILAKLLERTDNKMIRSMKVKKQMKRMVQDAWMFGTAIGKKGFGAQFQSTPEPIGDTSPPNAGTPGGQNEYIEYNYDLMNNMPWFLRAPPKTFVVPAETEYIEDARWTCFLIRRPLEDVQRDPRFKNAKNLGPNKTDVMKMSKTAEDAVPMIDLYEIRDKKTGMVFVICPNLKEKTLLFETDEFARLKINVASTLVFNDDDERFWGIPDSQILEPLQMELNEIRTYTMYHRRLTLARLLVRRNALSEEEALKLVSPDVSPVIWVDGDPRTVVNTITAADIPQGLVTSQQLAENDVRESLGFGRNQFGEFKSGSRSPTATEVDEVSSAAEIRVDERRDMVADLLVDVVSDFHPIIFDHWKNEQVEQIIGPAGIPFWIAFKPTMLKKVSFNVSADPDQSLPETKELREVKALKMYQTLATNPLIDPFKLTQYLLREMHGVQFDDMLRGLPQGFGMSPEQPFSVGQMGQLVQNVQQSNPRLLTQGPVGPVGGQQ